MRWLPGLFGFRSGPVSHRSRSLFDMGIRVLAEGPWHFLEKTLTDRVRETGLNGEGASPCKECWLLAAGPRLARHLQGHLARSLGAVQGVRVMQFSELTRRILLFGRTGSGTILDRLARDLLLHRVIADELPRLAQILETDTLRTPAFEQAAIKTLCDLREAGIDAEALRDLAARRRGRARSRLESLAGLHDAATEAFDRLAVPDSEAALRRAAEAVRNGLGLPARLFIGYGFYDLTGSQAELIEALSNALETVIAVPWYPETEIYSSELLAGWRERAEERLTGADDLEPPTLLSLGELWSDLARDADRSGGEPGPPPGPGRSVTVASHPGRGREVDAALRLLALAWRGGRRREETIVTAFAPETYRGSLCEQADSAGFGVPKREAALLTGFLRSLALGAEGEIEAGTLFDLLQSAALLLDRPLLPLPGAVRGLGRWPSGSLAAWGGSMRDRAVELEAGDESKALILREAADLIDELLPLSAILAEGGGAVRRLENLADAILPRLTSDQTETLLELIDQVRPVEALGKEYRSGDLLWIIGRLRHASGYARGTAAGAEPVELASVMEIRGGSWDVVIALGLGEGTIPSRPGPDPLLLDEDRRELAGERRWLLATQRRRMLEEKLLFRLLLESGRRVVLLYPRLDEAGRTRRMSPFVRDLLRTSGDLSGESEDPERYAARDSRTLGDIRLRPGEPLLGEFDRDLAAAGAALAAGAGEDTGGLHNGAAMLPVLWGAPTFAAGWRAERSRWEGEPGPWSGCLIDPNVRRQALERLGLAEGGRVSATLLQEYAACPWKIFVKRVLGLKEEDEEPTGLLDGAETGSVLHDVLQRFVTRADETQAWPPPPDALTEGNAALEEFAAREVRRAYRRRGGSSPAFERADTRRVLARLGAWLKWEAGAQSDRAPPSGHQVTLEAPAAAGWEVVACEEKFEIPLPVAGRHLFLQGRWDRVDRDAGGRLRILDYKTGAARPPEAGDLVGGLQLQMLLYLLAAREHFAGSGPGSGDGVGEIAGGVFLQLDPRTPRGDPKAVTWPGTLIGPGETRLGVLIDDLIASIESGVFLRLPHEKGTDSRTGLCTGCPTPSICRAWHIAESVRHLRHDRLHPLNRVRSSMRTAPENET